MTAFPDECTELAQGVRNQLADNDEWVQRYTGYAKEILDKAGRLIDNKSEFREWSPLYVYMNVTSARYVSGFDLRYLGQSVATLKVNSDGEPLITTGKEKDKNNERDFGCKICLDGEPWESKKAKEFRKHFDGHPMRSNASGKGKEEHRVESMLLTEFSKKSSDDKGLLNIQPVRFSGISRFQMPTPFGASNIKNHDLGYSGGSGGEIDILCRVGRGKGAKLCVMEVKDENKKEEPPTAAIKQGLVYATFLRELLRSESGNSWYRIFGFGRDVPKKLELRVACAMPSVEDNDTSFAGETIPIPGNRDNFELHYLYYTEVNGMVERIDTSLPECKAQA